MNELHYTLVTDGSSDQAFLPILDWSLTRCGYSGAIQGRYADLRHLRHKPKSLVERIRASVDLYPCDILFIHRDCETDTVRKRTDEIDEAMRIASTNRQYPQHICVVPKRMMEAWLLINESKIRTASGNPSGRVPLRLPRLREIESTPDPKALLFELLRTASEAQGRRLRTLNVHKLIHRIAELTSDFSPLEQLPSYIEFSGKLTELVASFQT